MNDQFCSQKQDIPELNITQTGWKLSFLKFSEEQKKLKKQPQLYIDLKL